MSTDKVDFKYLKEVRDILKDVEDADGIADLITNFNSEKEKMFKNIEILVRENKKLKEELDSYERGNCPICEGREKSYKNHCHVCGGEGEIYIKYRE